MAEMTEKERNSKHHRKPNRLIHEKSPYLLQHAYNPVDWYPWGAEAFEKAKTEEKLISGKYRKKFISYIHHRQYRHSFSDWDGYQPAAVTKGGASSIVLLSGQSKYLTGPGGRRTAIYRHWDQTRSAPLRPRH